MRQPQARRPPASRREADRSPLLAEDLHRVMRAAPAVEKPRPVNQCLRWFLRWFLLPDRNGSWFDTEAREQPDGSVQYVPVPGRAAKWTACFLAGLLLAGVAVPGPFIANKWMVAEGAKADAEELGWRRVALPEVYRNLAAVRNATTEAIDNPALPRKDRAAAVEVLVHSLVYFKRWDELEALDRRYVQLAPNVAPTVVTATMRVNPETVPDVVGELIRVLAPTGSEAPSLGYVSLLMLDERWGEVDRALSNRRALLSHRDPPVADPDGLLLQIAATQMRPDATFGAGGVDAAWERYRRLEVLWSDYSSSKGSDPFLYALWLHADGRIEDAINEYDRLAANDDRALLGSILARAELAKYNSKWLDAAQALARGPGRHRLRNQAAVASLLSDLRGALANRSGSTSESLREVFGRHAKALAAVPVHAPPQLLEALGTRTLHPTSVGDWPAAVPWTPRRP